jgi:hypothetical protein
MFDTLRAICAALSYQPEPAPAPTGPTLVQMIEAQDFTAADAGPPYPDRFAMLASSAAGCLKREMHALAAVEAIETQPRPSDRPQGLEWAYAELFHDSARLRQVVSLLRDLAPIEPEVRALIACRQRRAGFGG